MSIPSKKTAARRRRRAPHPKHPELESVLLTRALQGATMVVSGARRVSHLAVEAVTAAARPVRRLGRGGR